MAWVSRLRDMAHFYPTFQTMPNMDGPQSRVWWKSLSSLPDRRDPGADPGNITQFKAARHPDIITELSGELYSVSLKF